MNFAVADLRTYSKKTQMQRKKMLMGKMGRNHDITLTPRDFNYDNHHYQYLKYTKRGKVSLLLTPHFRCKRQGKYHAVSLPTSRWSSRMEICFSTLATLYIFLRIRNCVQCITRRVNIYISCPREKLKSFLLSYKKNIHLWTCKNRYYKKDR